MKPTLLVVDDEPAIVSSIIRSLEDEYHCLGASGAAEARKLFEGHRICCVLSDQRMPGENGAEFLAWVKETHPDTVRILITGFSDFDSIVAAVNKGQIYHFLHKPWEPVQLEVVIRQAVEMYRLVEDNRRLAAELKVRNQALERENIQLKAETIATTGAFKDLIGLSEPMQRLKTKLQALLPSQSTVLVTGESGTGKELVARALHFGGTRKDKAFVAQNCAALPDSILESELFGHVKGAFTHATETRMGIIESANGGTLFLDEVGDMTLTMQAKLLRFLQEGVITQVGGRAERKVDVRVIAATHRDLEAMVKDKTFREDLYYRLAVVPLRTPSLRERQDDIPLLAEHFLRKKASKLNRKSARLSPEAAALLSSHPFPGNVRELENAVEYALNMLGERDVIAPDDLPDRIAARAAGTAESAKAASSPVVVPAAAGTEPGAEGIPAQPGESATAAIPRELLLDEAVMALEVEWINRAMRMTSGNISQAARALGLSRQGLHNKLAKYGIREG
ncbi:MAG TPA: sigma-54 dependent transcriptional regulator [Fibrobacteria bacterium]|nr:sigma-54 dependent transcriptional regulator [Fibrobacteria bacterium]